MTSGRCASVLKLLHGYTRLSFHTLPPVLRLLIVIPWFSCTVTVDDTVYPCQSDAACGNGWSCKCDSTSSLGGVCVPSAQILGVDEVILLGGGQCSKVTPADTPDDNDIVAIQPLPDTGESDADPDITVSPGDVTAGDMADSDDVVLPFCSSNLDGTPCDDADRCTDNDQCLAGFCVGDMVFCDDNNACTIDVCDRIVGCTFTNSDDPCDDGDMCTDGDICNAGTCIGSSTNLACLPPNAFCEIIGTAGSQVICPLKVARATENTPPPAAIQFNIEYDPQTISPVRFQDLVCMTETRCFVLEVPPASLYPSGHTMMIAPTKVSEWQGLGSVILANAGNPTSSATNAYFTQELTLVGDPVFVEFVVQLVADISPSEPKYLFFDNVVAASAAAEPLYGKVIATVMVVSSSD